MIMNQKWTDYLVDQQFMNLHDFSGSISVHFCHLSLIYIFESTKPNKAVWYTRLEHMGSPGLSSLEINIFHGMF